MTTKGSIGTLAEQIVNEVKSESLTKLAQTEFVKVAEKAPNPKTAVGQLLHKIAADLRASSGSDDAVTIGDVKEFLREVGYAG
jgi:hypothetical protein